MIIIGTNSKGMFTNKPQRNHKIHFRKLNQSKKKIEIIEITTKILPTKQSIEGLPDILKENSILHYDDKIITRGSKDTLNCKLLASDCQARETFHNDDDKYIIESANQFDEKEINRRTPNCNPPYKVEVAKENSCSQSYKKHELLLNLKQFNNNDQQRLKLPAISSTAIEVENEKIGKIKKITDKVMDKNNNQNDDILTIDLNMPTLNPSTSTKLNYVSNRNLYVPINDANSWSKESLCDGESIDAKCNHKLPINQLHDKIKCNNNNINIGSSCKININSKPPLCKYYNKNKDDANGNCFSNEKISKKIITNNKDASILQKKSINSHSINNNINDNLKEISNSKSYNDINSFQQTNHENEIKCRRKSVSEYIEFWSNMQR